MKYILLSVFIFILGALCIYFIQNNKHLKQMNTQDVNLKTPPEKLFLPGTLVKVKIANQFNDIADLDENEVKILNDNKTYKSIKIKVLSVINNPTNRKVPSNFNFRIQPSEYDLIGKETYLVLDIPEVFDSKREYQIYPVCGLSTSSQMAEVYRKNNN